MMPILSERELEYIRSTWRDMRDIPDPRAVVGDLLAHVDALTAERDALKAERAALQTVIAYRIGRGEDWGLALNVAVTNLVNSPARRVT